MPTGLDTNILVYSLDSQAGYKHNIAVSIVEDVLRNPDNYLISTQVIAEMLYVVKRKRMGEQLAIRLAVTLIQRVRIVTYTPIEVLQAAASPSHLFWDRLLAHTYLNNGADKILTEDEKPYKGIIEPLNPFSQTPGME